MIEAWWSEAAARFRSVSLGQHEHALHARFSVDLRLTPLQEASTTLLLVAEHLVEERPTLFR